MTSLVRRVAGGLTVLEGLWLAYAYFDMPTLLPSGRTPFIPTYSVEALALALIVLAVGALGVWGASFAYVAGAVLSAAVLLLTAFTVLTVAGSSYPAAVSDDAMIGVAFALVALVVDVGAARSKESISEQANPMNLPVFG